MRTDKDIAAAESLGPRFETDCYKWKTCVCSGKGLDGWYFHSNLVSLLKPHVVLRRNKKGERRPKKERTPLARRLLDEALLVLELTKEASGFAPAPSSRLSYSGIFREEGWGDAALADLPACRDDERESSGSDAVQTTRWFHMSFCNFRTYAFATLELEEAPEQPFRDRKVCVSHGSLFSDPALIHSRSVLTSPGHGLSVCVSFGKTKKPCRCKTWLLTSSKSLHWIRSPSSGFGRHGAFVLGQNLMILEIPEHSNSVCPQCGIS